jgi:ribonuclease-3
LRTALTHSSYANEYKGFEHNERLEFLGDAVLGLVIAEYCYHNFPDDEGKLTEKRISVVKNIRLAQAADEMGLEEYLLIGKGEYENNDEKARKKRIGNALEALIGAIFLEKDYKTARQFIIERIKLYPI